MLFELVTLILAQDPDLERPIQNAELRVFDSATRELTAEVKSKQVRTGDQGLFLLTRPVATLYTKDSENKPKQVTIQADCGTYNKDTQRLVLEGNVSAASAAGEWFR